MFDPSSLTTTDLLQAYVSILRELRERGIVRTSNNPIGDYTEWLVASKLGLTLATSSMKGYDATGADGLQYQIKSRRLTATNRSCQLGAIRDHDKEVFHFLIAVVYEEDWSIRSAYKIPNSAISALGRFSSRHNGFLILATDKLLDHPGVTSIGEQLQ